MKSSDWNVITAGIQTLIKEEEMFCCSHLSMFLSCAPPARRSEPVDETNMSDPTGTTFNVQRWAKFSFDWTLHIFIHSQCFTVGFRAHQRRLVVTMEDVDEVSDGQHTCTHMETDSDDVWQRENLESILRFVVILQDHSQFKGGFPQHLDRCAAPVHMYLVTSRSKCHKDQLCVLSVCNATQMSCGRVASI